MGASIYAASNIEGSDAGLGYQSDYQGKVSSGEITQLQNDLNYAATLPTDNAEVIGDAAIGGFSATFIPWDWDSFSDSLNSSCP